MTKLQLLHRALNERLMAAVEQIMEMVGGTVLEYEEETIRARKENEALRRRLRWIEGASSAGWQGPSEPVTVSIPDELNPSQQDDSTVNFEFGPESDAVVIKTESTDFPLCSRPENNSTLLQSADQGPDNAGTSAGVSWDSAQSYMAPLDFDPTSGPKRVSQWSGQQGRRQRMSFACPDCGKVFGAKQRLLIHMRIHSTERPYTYRRRKECFYGENKKKRNLHNLSKMSREVVDDLSDGSEQINRSSASPAVNVQEEEPEGFSSESDIDKEPKSAATLRMHRQSGKKRQSSSQLMCTCPYCPGREFARPCQLAMHMKTHKDESLVNVLGQAQSSTDAVLEAERKLPKVTFLPKRCFSKVWDYFSKDAFGDVSCHECSARVSQGSNKASRKNTSNLWSHLRLKHRCAYLEAKAYSRPVNVPMNTLDTTPIKLEDFVKEEPIEGGGTETIKVTFLPKRCFSKVWDYFSKDALGDVFCHECAARISQGSKEAARKNTSNLWSHLRIKHQHAYLEAKAYSRPVNGPMNTLDTTPIKLEDFEPEEPIEGGGSETIKKQGKNDAVKKSKVAAKAYYPCPECDKTFALKTRLIFHMNTHKSKKALLQKSLEMAVQTEPIKEETMAVTKTAPVKNVKARKKSVSCPHCTKVFTSEVWLERHTEMQHKGEKSKIEPLNFLFPRGPRKSKRLLKQLRKLRAEAKAVTDSSKPETKSNSKKLATKWGIAEKETEDSETVTTENQGVTEETEESEVTDKAIQSCQESNMVVDGPKITADEGAGLLTCASEKTSGKDGGASKTDIPKKFSCQICGKIFPYEIRLKKHRKRHAGQILHEKKVKKRRQAQKEEEEKLMGREKKRRKEDDNKTSTSLNTKYEPNATQTPQGSPNTELLQKSRTRGQGPLPCPFCGKVFAWEMRLLMHMQIHCGEKPYPYRQRKKHFYGVLKRGQLPNNQEPHGNNSDESEQSADEETVNEDKSTHLSSTESTALEDCSGHPGLLPQTAVEQTATIIKKNQRTNLERISNIMSHFRLEPRIVLKPITTEYQHCTSVSEDLQSAGSEPSEIDHEQPSCSVLSDKPMEDALENEIVSSNLCAMPVKDSAFGIQNKPEKCSTIISPEKCSTIISEEDIVSVVVCSPKRDSQTEVLFDGSLGIESSEVQQEEDRDFNFVSETIIIDDKPEETTGGTKFQSAPPECGKTKCDCNNIHSMKLTLMPHADVVQSLFKETCPSAMQRNVASVCVVLSDSEDSVDEDVSSDEPTALVSVGQNEPLDVGSKPSENSSNDSNCPAPDKTESINTDGDDSLCVHTKSIDAPSKETDVEFVPAESMESRTSDDTLTIDQMISAAIGQVEDSPMNLEETFCQTSDMVFTGQASVSEVNAGSDEVDGAVVMQ